MKYSAMAEVIPPSRIHSSVGKCSSSIRPSAKELLPDAVRVHVLDCAQGA